MTREEYDTITSQFRAMILSEAQKPEEERVFPDEWLMIDVIATCRTPGCPREGFSHPLRIAEPADGVYRVLCAQCSKAVEDLNPQLEDDPDFRLNVRHENGDLGVMSA